MFSSKNISVVIASIVVGSILASTAAASPMVAVSANSTGYTVSSTDLINGQLGVVNAASNIQDEESLGSNTTGAALTNGAFGPAGLTASPNADVTIVHNGTVLTYTLGAGPFGGGYDVTAIDTFAGWRDSGRSRQDYTVSYSLLSAPSTFLPISSVTTSSVSNNDTAAFLTDTTGSLANHVAAIQFSFPSTQNGYVGYRELDVIGHAVPEPASLVLCGLGAVGLLAAARRRRKA